MANFVDFINWLDQIGVADVLLPFLLIFVIVFAILQKIELFGERKKVKKFHVIISLILALAVVFPHILGVQPDIIPIMNQALPNVSIILVAIIMFLLILGAFGAKYDVRGISMGAIISVIAAIIIIYIFGAAAGWGWKIPRALSFLENQETITMFIIILVFGLIIAYITKEEKKPPKEGEEKERETLLKILKEPVK